MLSHSFLIQKIYHVLWIDLAMILWIGNGNVDRCWDAEFVILRREWLLPSEMFFSKTDVCIA
jgi:hypothetical protein